MLEGVLCQQLVPTADRQGRAMALEIMVATPAIRNLIREEKLHQIYSAMQAGQKFGMQTMNQSLAGLVQKRRITPGRSHAPHDDPRRAGEPAGRGRRGDRGAPAAGGTRPTSVFGRR